MLGRAFPDPAADRLDPLTGHLGQVLRQTEILRQALRDLVGGREQMSVRQDAEPGQRTAGRIELVLRQGCVPGREKLGDPVQGHQRRQGTTLGERFEEPLLRGSGREFCLIGLRPVEQSGRKRASVAVREVRERADARVAAVASAMMFVCLSGSFRHFAASWRSVVTCPTSNAMAFSRSRRSVSDTS